MTQVDSQRIRPGYEPIEGYVLEERLGRGGYGEVWRAEAPGGLKKAVKFVFGQHDEKFAAQELKSLERIKGIQHPFILTLERFELIENQLVIVTELADGTLEDIYRRHRRRGSCGIPRDELLQYMRDAADALDYLHRLYQLQHLDVKPGNLLIVGGRVKVADFGLIKDLGEAECSLVGGLTPIYAPPEVFDGRPSMHSDQYSLAVMYQELLTSTRPFAGRTIAQLATQHVHNAPDLGSLPPPDRPVVARALEKAPERRFTSCSELVERLLRRPAAVAADQAVACEPQAKPAAAVESLPKLERSDAAPAMTGRCHALVVALGGTGAEALTLLRSQVGQWGASSPVTLHSVLIDTDTETIRASRLAEANARLPACHGIATPMKSAEEYRRQGTARLKSISRRWIYNVPRNQKTGGLRPLGRLALVDHADDVLGGLRRAVEQVLQTREPGEATTAYVIGSLAGGTGGGMYIDVVHLLRHLLDEAGLEDLAVISLLTTSRFQGTPSHPLTLHCMKSALSELNHFLAPGNSYPGDAAVGWPGVPAGRSPLRDAYLIAPATSGIAPAPVQTAVQYLWCDITGCGDWFASGRDAASDSASHRPSIRTLGAAPVGSPVDHRSSVLAPYASRQLLLRWLGDPRRHKKAAQELASRVGRRCYLDAKLMRDQCERSLGDDAGERRAAIKGFLQKLDANARDAPKRIRPELVRWLTGAMDVDHTDGLAERIVSEIEREIYLRLQDGRLALSAAIAGLGLLKAHSDSLQQQLSEQSRRALGELERAQPASEPPASDDGASLTPALQLGEALVTIVAARSAAQLANDLGQRLSQLIERYSDAAARIAQAINLLDGKDGSVGPAEMSSDAWQRRLAPCVDQLDRQQVPHELFRVIHSPAATTAAGLIERLNAAATRLIRDRMSASEDEPAASQLLSQGAPNQPVQDSARLGSTPLGSTRPTSAGSAASIEDSDPPESTTATLSQSGPPTANSQTRSWHRPKQPQWWTLEAAIDVIRPPLLECGGKRRYYLVCPSQRECDKLLQQWPRQEHREVTPLVNPASGAMLIEEAQQIGLKDVIAWLDSLTGNDGKISARLATRCDVDWS